MFGAFFARILHAFPREILPAMTKKFIPASFLALACACAYGATLTGGTSAANATSFGDYSTEDVTLNPPSSGSTGYFNGNNQTAQSVVAGGNASVSGGFNVNFDAGMYDYAIDASNGNLTLTNGTYSVKSAFEGDDIYVNTASGKTFTLSSGATFNSNTGDLLIFQGGGEYSIAGKLNANSFDLRGSTLTQTGKVTVGAFNLSNRSGNSATKYTVKSGGELYTDSISLRGTYAEYTLRIEGYLKNSGVLEVGAQYNNSSTQALAVTGTVDTNTLHNAGALVDVRAVALAALPALLEVALVALLLGHPGSHGSVRVPPVVEPGPAPSAHDDVLLARPARAVHEPALGADDAELGHPPPVVTHAH